MKTFTQTGRITFLKTALRTNALKMYPWAQHTVIADGGYYCFEKQQDYIDFKRRLQDDINQAIDMVGIS
jgi:hypothetical protein